MYAIGPLHAPAATPPLAPSAPTVDTDTNETDTSTTRSNIETIKDVVNKVVSLVRSKEAVLLCRILMVTVVFGAVLSWIVVVHGVVLATKAAVNTVSFTVWGITMVNFVHAKTLGYKASARRSPSFWSVSMNTSSWCNVEGVRRVWGFTDRYCSTWWV